MSENLRKNLSRASTRSSLYGGPALLAPGKEARDVIEMAKKDLEKLKKKEKKKKKRYVFKLAHSCEALVRSWKCVRITAALPGSRNWRAVNVQPECRLLACCNYLLIPCISSLHPVVSLMECVLHSVATSPTRWRPLIAYPFAASVLYIFISIPAWDLQVTKNYLFSLNQVFSHEICLSLRLHNQNPSFELLFWVFVTHLLLISLALSLCLSLINILRFPPNSVACLLSLPPPSSPSPPPSFSPKTEAVRRESPS